MSAILFFLSSTPQMDWNTLPDGAEIKDTPVNVGHWFDPWVRKILWSRKWQPILVFLPGKFHGQRSRESYSPWSCKETDITEGAHTHTPLHIKWLFDINFLAKNKLGYRTLISIFLEQQSCIQFFSLLFSNLKEILLKEAPRIKFNKSNYCHILSY